MVWALSFLWFTGLSPKTFSKNVQKIWWCILLETWNHSPSWQEVLSMWSSSTGKCLWLGEAPLRVSGKGTATAVTPSNVPYLLVITGGGGAQKEGLHGVYWVVGVLTLQYINKLPFLHILWHIYSYPPTTLVNQVAFPDFVTNIFQWIVDLC